MLVEKAHDAGLRKNQGLTWNLTGIVTLITFGTWFPMGFVVAAMNGPQSVIVNWIRSLKCREYGDTFGLIDFDNNNTAQDLDLWCKFIPESEEPNMLKENFDLNSIWTVISAMLNAGGLVGIFTSASLVHRVGLKGSIYILTSILACGIILLSVAPLAGAHELLSVGRFIIGFALGITCVVPPIYTSEITPVALRGAMGTLPMIMYVLGLITATALGFPMILGTADGWPILMAIPLIALVVLFLGLPLCPDSPRRLFITKGDKVGAKKALVCLRGTWDVLDEMTAMQAEKEAEQDRVNVTLLGVLRDPFLRSTFFLCAVPMLAQQLSGYMGISFYSTQIFTGIGLTRLESMYVSLGLWATYLLFSLLSMIIVDRAGRRSVLLSSHTLMALFLALFMLFMNLSRNGFNWAPIASVVCMVLYVASYAGGSASVPYILPTEMFAQEARTPAMTLVASMAWLGGLIVTSMFPLVEPVLGEFTFLFFIAAVVLGGVFIAWKLPETKGKSIEEIQMVLRDRLLKTNYRP